MRAKLSFILFIFLSSLVYSQPPGSLDLAFGNAGKVVSSFSSSIERANAVGLQSDGKIVIAGFASYAATGKDFLVARYNTDGTLDAAFGNNGSTTLDLQLGSDDVANGLVIDNQGRIILAGNSDDGINKNAALVRFTADGALDVSFGNNGLVLLDLVSGQQDEIKVIKQHLVSGKLIIGGQSASTSNIALPVIARLSEDGIIDSTFNGIGILTPTVSAGDLQRSIMVEDLEVTANGKISAAGWRKYVSTSISSEFWACRVLSNGTLDNTFSSDGVLTYSETGGSYYAYSLELNDNQDLIIGGTRSYLGSNDFRIFTVTNLGTIANTTSNYYVSTDVDISFAMTRDMDGKYIMSGSAGSATSRNFGTLRLLAPGDLQADYSFDTDGRVQTNFGGNLMNECFDVVVQNDNKIVCVGYGGSDIAICRYLGYGVPQLDGFALSTPANNSINQDFTGVNLTWTEAFGATTYEIEVATDINFSNIIVSGPVATAGAVVNGLSPATAYWWRVRAGDGISWGTFVGPWKFTTIGMTSFSLSTPANNANNVAYAAVVFNWTDNVGAVNYQMELADNMSFTGAQVFTTTTSTKTVNNLLASTTYYWRVKASHNGTDYGTWVGPWVFNTQAAPVGISELGLQDLRVYPNPAHESLHIPMLHAGEELIVLDVQGKICLTSNLAASEQCAIDISQLEKGYYILRIGKKQYPFIKE